MPEKQIEDYVSYRRIIFWSTLFLWWLGLILVLTEKDNQKKQAGWKGFKFAIIWHVILTAITFFLLMFAFVIWAAAR